MATRTVLSILVFFALAACGGSGGPGTGQTGDQSLIGTPKGMLTLREQLSCSEYRDYVSDSIADLVINAGIYWCPGCETLSAGGIPTAGLAGGGAANSPPSFDGFTGTNNQEAGVDELDRVEVDGGGFFYVIDGRYLVVANGLPPDDLREIASLELDPDRLAEGLVLDPVSQRLVVVLSPRYYIADFGSIWPPQTFEPTTELLFIDVANPANPVIDRRLKVEGFSLAVRRIDDRVHLVTHWTPIIPASIIDDAEVVRLREDLADALDDATRTAVLTGELRDRIDLLVGGTDVREFLPELSASVGAQPYVDITAADCAGIAVPDVSLALALTSVTSVDIDGTNVDSLAVVNSAWNVYASADNVYLTQASSGWWFSDRQRQQTAVFKVGIGSGAPEYLATGLVDGWAQSTFQFGEHDGYLRVVTHRWELDPGPDEWLQHNNLYVLADDGAGDLGVVGSVEGFGADELIFSTRLIGDRGFVVTFRQIDPLFAFDLSDPNDPRLVGEVEITGVSTYLHPLDDTHLLTIGFDGDDQTLNGDFRLQIFDVQNLDDPRLIHAYVPQFDSAGFAWTTAVFDHLAFNYFPEAGTLTVPVQYSALNFDEHFSGFLAFSVDTASGFTELGRLDHSDLAQQRLCVDPTGGRPVFCDDGSYLEAALPRRAVSAIFNGETFIYTVSNVGMKVSPALDFENPVAVMHLPYRDDYPWLVVQ